MSDSTDREGAADGVAEPAAGAAPGDVGGPMETDSMLDPEGFHDASQGRDASSGWVPETRSGWSVDELEALIRNGVPVVRVDGDSRVAEGEEVRAQEYAMAARSWVDDLAQPEHGPVSWLAERAPSGALLSDLESLPEDMVADDYDSVEMVALWARIESYCAARKRTAAATMARQESMANGLAHLAAMGIEAGEVSIAADELSVRFGITKPAAARLVRAGRAMGEIGIPTGDSLTSGEIDAVKADLILEAITDLGADAALSVQERVLPKAPHMSTGQLRREVAAACAAVDPDQFEQRCADAAQSRRVNPPRALPHGMASLYAVMPAVEASQVYRAVDAAARSAKNSGDERTMDQLRADALAAMGFAAVQTGWIGPPPSVAEVPSTSTPADVGEPDAVDHDGGPSMRVGHIGGASAHVRVVVPFTVLMDHPPAAPDPDPPPDGSDAGQAPRDCGTTDLGHPPPPDNVAHHDGRDECERSAHAPEVGGAVKAAAATDAVVCPEGDATSSGAAASGPRAAGVGGTSTAGVPARLTSVPDQLTVAFLDGYGPIPASAARALAAGSTWSRLVLDPIDRTVLEVSSPRYRPPESMARLVRAAQPYCAAPTCNVSADSCDLNHRIPYPVGATSVWNLDPDCRRDHLLITHGGWRYQQDAHPGGTRTWTTATGHVYEQQADGKVRMIARPQPAQLPGDDTPPPF